MGDRWVELWVWQEQGIRGSHRRAQMLSLGSPSSSGLNPLVPLVCLGRHHSCVFWMPALLWTPFTVMGLSLGLRSGIETS